ncbi:AAA+ family ATPase [Actinobacteria bacterium IMCC26207]|nr:AAA+ family ATPase [Actinobacteria bacterium IMCC26207]
MNNEPLSLCRSIGPNSYNYGSRPQQPRYSLAVSTSVLDAVVDSFVEDLTQALISATAQLPDVNPQDLRSAVTVEAFNLATAMIDADERHTTDELENLIQAFGHRLPDTQLLMATPETLRGSDLVVGRRHWLEADSELFGILADADARQGTDLAQQYYNRSLDIAHVVASLDVVTSAAELTAISALRSKLLAGMRSSDADAANLAGPKGTQPKRSAEPVADAEPESAAGAEEEAETDTAKADPPERPLEELLAELDTLVGLREVKERVHLVADFLCVQGLRAARNLPTMETSNHLVFTGNPGTGKTTVARLLAQIYRTLGVVARGQLIETDRSGLVAGFVGQTAPLVRAKFDEAEEGMLFIDEAYTLVRGGENDFGREAIDQIVKLMEDRRDSVVLVVAGYPEEMQQFLSANPGLRSRFPTTIEFPDYSTEELMQIVDSMGTKERYELTPEARTAFAAQLDSLPREKGFGNARVARNMFEAAVNRHASRVVKLEQPTEHDLTALVPADLGAPDLGAPDLGAPDLGAPDLSEPDLSVPAQEAP